VPVCILVLISHVKLVCGLPSVIPARVIVSWMLWQGTLAQLIARVLTPPFINTAIPWRVPSLVPL
jgi:hypothetical protein